MSQSFDTMRGTPPGILPIRSLRGKEWSLTTFRYMVLLITFIAYACYHASRKPISIVKSVLDPEPNKVSGDPWPMGEVFVRREWVGSDMMRLENKGWAPFNGTDGTTKLVVYLFLAAYPEDIGFRCPNGSVANVETGPSNEEAQIRKGDLVEGTTNTVPQYASVNRRSVGLIQACLIPGVIPFSLCLFFSKLVAYTFLYCLPFYLSQTAIGGEYMSVKSAGNLSTMFDVGGIVGGILAGYISDKLNARAITAASFMYAAIPSMLLFRSYGSVSRTVNIVLMMIAGLFVNGPYALITTAVSADLGTHSSLRGDSRALATVTAIIDGTGSLGAALGPLLTGFISTKGWDAVFVMLMAGALVVGLLLSPLVIAEITEKTCKRMPLSSEQQSQAPASSQPLLSDQR